MIGLGIDVGGTATRWALASADGASLAEGAVGSLSGLMLNSPESTAQFHAELQKIGQVVPQRPTLVWMGLTGGGPGFDTVRGTQIIANALGLDASQVRVVSDIMMLHQLHFGPGQGHVLYAGTGSYASFWDASGTLQRVGGRGALVDDAGSGVWIGLEALRAIWRAEESLEPRGAMAQAVFAHLGADDWKTTRSLVYGQAISQARGGIAAITRCVAATEHTDPIAAGILHRTGKELARLALASIKRHGPAELMLAGGVLLKSKTVQASCAAALVQGGFTRGFSCSDLEIAQTAAQRAARGDVPDRQQSVET